MEKLDISGSEIEGCKERAGGEKWPTKVERVETSRKTAKGEGRVGVRTELVLRSVTREQGQERKRRVRSEKGRKKGQKREVGGPVKQRGCDMERKSWGGAEEELLGGASKDKELEEQMRDVRKERKKAWMEMRGVGERANRLEEVERERERCGEGREDGAKALELREREMGKERNREKRRRREGMWW
ncbi:hypothetical protein KM043_018225 [Ampulex compressa]|nr:hypothetical protein KM043_018225 [Ampulex compressa]